MTWKRWAVAGYCVTTIGATLAGIHAESPIPAMGRVAFLVVAVATVVGPFVGPHYLLAPAELGDLGAMVGGIVLLATLVGMIHWGLASVRDALAQWRRRPTVHVDQVFLDQRTYIVERERQD